ncbi:MAG: YdeI/OmpD-associated family protein [Thermoflexibacteraceae bacterium]
MNPAVDNYIAKAQPFAQPILHYLRDLVHQTCPNIEEKIKWGMPHFDYKGEMLCGMAAFKHHCSFGFWKASLMSDKTLMYNAQTETAMGHLGKITSLKSLPSKAKMVAYLKEAMALNDAGIKVKKEKKEAVVLPTPEALTKALKQNKIAKAVWEKFAPSHKKEYIQWIVEAKTETTQEKRIAQALVWMAEGKHRNWKYDPKYLSK